MVCVGPAQLEMTADTHLETSRRQRGYWGGVWGGENHQGLSSREMEFKAMGSPGQCRHWRQGCLGWSPGAHQNFVGEPRRRSPNGGLRARGQGHQEKTRQEKKKPEEEGVVSFQAHPPAGETPAICRTHWPEVGHLGSPWARALQAGQIPAESPEEAPLFPEKGREWPCQAAPVKMRGRPGVLGRVTQAAHFMW